MRQTIVRQGGAALLAAACLIWTDGALATLSIRKPTVDSASPEYLRVIRSIAGAREVVVEIRRPGR